MDSPERLLAGAVVVLSGVFAFIAERVVLVLLAQTGHITSHHESNIFNVLPEGFLFHCSS